MSRSLKARLLVRVAAGVLACAGATFGFAATANADSSGGNVAPPASAELATAVGPNSTYPGPGWFFYTAFVHKNDCDLSGFLWVASGQATGSVCHPRFDGFGYDLWLRI